MIQVGTVRNPFAPLEREVVEYHESLTIAEALERHPMPDYLPFVAFVNGKYVLRSEGWDTYQIPDGGTCHFISVVQGGGGQGGGKKNPLATILILVVAVALAYASGGATAYLAGTWVGTSAGAVYALGAGLVLAGASYLINMALPPSYPKPVEAPDPAYSIVGRSNQARLGAPIEVQYGTLKAYPSICTSPYREFSDSFDNNSFDNTVAQQTLFEVYHIGWGYYGDLEYDFLDQSIDSFPEAVLHKFEPGEQITSFPSAVIDVPAASEIPLPFLWSNPANTGTAIASTIFDGSDEVNEQQSITVGGWDSGTFKLSLNGEDSADLGLTATADDMKEALEDLVLLAIPDLTRPSGGNVAVELVAASATSRTWYVEFIGNLSLTNVGQLVVIDTALVESEEAYPNWANVLHDFRHIDLDELSTEVHIVDSGVDADGLGYLTMSDSVFGVEDSLVGHTLVFAPILDLAVHGHPGIAVTSGAYRNYQQYITTVIHSNTDDTLRWVIDAAPSTLRSALTNEPHRARTVNDPDTEEGRASNSSLVLKIENAYASVVEFNNWTSTFKINPDESSEEINYIGVDIALPSGAYSVSDGGNTLYHTPQFQLQCQQLDEDGEPVAPWRLATTDPKYLRGVDTNIYHSAIANLNVRPTNRSPLRFSARLPVEQGRWQFRMANTFAAKFFLATGVTDNDPNHIDKDSEFYANVKYRDFDSDSGSGHLKSFLVGLRGYSTKRALSWEGRTVVAVRLTGTENVNSNTLQQFGVKSTRLLQDYNGAVDDGTLPTDPFTTEIFSGVRTTAPSSDSSLTLELRESSVSLGGIGNRFLVGEYVRLSGFSGDAAANNGTYKVLRKSDNTLIVRADLVSAVAASVQKAGSRRVYGVAPTVLGGVAIDADTHTILKTGVGALDDFTVGSKFYLSGFTNDENNQKFTITARTANTLVVAETLVAETATSGKKIHSVPPNGLIGQLLDGMRVAFSGATSVGGIDAASINTVIEDNVAVVVDATTKLTTLEKTGIGLLAQSVVGATVTLGGFTEKENQDSAVITAVVDNAITVARPKLSEKDPTPKRSSFVSEAAAVGKCVMFGAREIVRTGDTSFYFYADDGATSEATGGGTVSYSFKNEWTDLRPSERISSAMYDLATNNDFGSGTDPERIDVAGMRVLEDTWDSRDRYGDDGITWKEDAVKDTYNFRLSERKKITEHFTDLARCGRARVVYPAGKLTMVRDEPRAAADAMFTKMNIAKGTLKFTATFPTDDTPDHVLVQFFNKEFWDYDEVICTTTPYSLSQRITLNHVTSGEWSLTYGDYTTDDLASTTLTAAALEAALELLPNVVAGSFDVTGTTGGPFLLTYAGALLGKDVRRMSANQGTLVGGRAIVSYNTNPAWPGVAPARLLMPGVTSRKHAWREGMYEYGSLTERRLLTRFDTDMEGYLPSYLSRITVTDEFLEHGQSGIVIDAVDNGGSFSLFTSEPLDWSEAGTHVIQLRDNMGKPTENGLFEVTQGDFPNEAVIPGDLATTSEAIGLHTEHMSGREATFFSFGLVGQHSLDLLVTGLRASSSNRWNIEGYVYKVEGVYDLDDDLQYVPATEEELLDVRKVGRVIKGLRAHAFPKTPVLAFASWAASPWASHYLAEISIDEGASWRSIEKTTNTNVSFVPSDFVSGPVAVELDFTVGVVSDSFTTIIGRRPASQPTAWTDGQYDGKYLLFTTGANAGKKFRIAKTEGQLLYFDVKILPRPDAGDDTYDIVSAEGRTVLIGVSGYNVIYSPRATTTLRLPVENWDAVASSSDSGVVTTKSLQTEANPLPKDTVTELFRRDEYGNLFISGKVFEADHVSRLVHIGTELQYGTADLVTCYLPAEPRVVGGVPSCILFDGNTRLVWVASAPAAGEWSYTGTTVTLGADKTDAVRVLMVATGTNSSLLDDLNVGVPVTFTAGTAAAVLPEVPALASEVLLFKNDVAMTPVLSSPGATEFTSSGTAITAGSNFEAGDSVVALFVGNDGDVEPSRLRVVSFAADELPLLPLYPGQVAVLESGNVRWHGGGSYNFQAGVPGVSKTELVWGADAPAAGTRYALLLEPISQSAPNATIASMPFVVTEHTEGALNERRLVDGINSTVSDGGPGGDISIDFAGGFIGNAGVYPLDNTDFDGLETEFPGLLDPAPDLTAGKTVALLLQGAGPIYRMAGDITPTAGRFSLYGTGMSSVRFGDAPETGDVGIALYAAGETLAPPRYIGLMGTLYQLDAGLPFAEWIIPDDVSGVLPIGASGSRSRANVTALAEGVMEMLVDSGSGFVSVGDLTFGIGDAEGVFTVASAVPLEPGYVLRLMNPDPAVSGLAGVTVTLRISYT